MDQGQNTQPDSVTLENARIGYQAAVALWIYQAQQAWNRLNVMLVTIVLLLPLWDYLQQNPAHYRS